MTMDQILDVMWKDYLKLNPAAARVYDLFQGREKRVVNDHIALRTFRHPRLGLESLADYFKKYGYEEKQDYVFEAKKLYAKHYEHADPLQPKIFISELLLEQCSERVRDGVNRLVEQMPNDWTARADYPASGRPWNVSYQDYLQLAEESEYASWVAAYGFRPNHFTVSINHLESFQSVEEVNAFLKEHGFVLNGSGGEVKGSPSEYLEQSSTMASEIPVSFSDGSYPIPGCYYEFAKRYPLIDGRLYQGFVAQSADRIFESTDRVRH